MSSTCQATVDSSCEYHCNEGYHKNFWNGNITCETSTRWSENPHLLCTDHTQCPYEILNGDLDLSCGRSPGETCTYVCHEGYFPSENSGTIICDSSNSLWDKNTSSLCVKIYCPLAIPNGEISSVCSREYNAACYSYVCSSGYEKPLRVVTLKCNGSSLWEWDREITDWPCLNQNELCPKTIRNGKIDRLCERRHGSTCGFKCEDGCQKIVNRLLTCQSSGLWDLPANGACVYCVKSTTTSSGCPQSIPNGKILTACYMYIRPGKTCSFICSPGCFPAANNLYCSSLGYWINGDNACICDQNSTGTLTSEKDSENPLETGTIIGIIVGVIIVVIVLTASVIICVVLRHKRRESSGVISYHATGTTEQDTRVTPTAPVMEPPEVDPFDVISRSTTDVNDHHLPFPESKTFEQPPSYSEVVSDPGKFDAQ